MRSCGVLLHISSLPGQGGVGTFGSEARKFIDFLQSAGQSWWQILPLTPPAQGNSPYSSYSVFAGNPAFISLELLEEDGLLAFWTRKFLPRHTGERANYEYCSKVHLPLLRQTLSAGSTRYATEFRQFREQNSYWLPDYALFMALKKQQDGAPYYHWPQPLAMREPEAMATVQKELKEEIHFWQWVQFLFFRQWGELKSYARQQNIGIIGDMPIYVDVDSADVWAHPSVFQLDERRRPTAVAGVPPDDFSEDGQLWGNPLYDWNALRTTDYQWWMERLGHAGRMYDMVRLDHFRALDEYFAIPAGAENAREGQWMPGPGMDFLKSVQRDVPGIHLIAEDLGLYTDSLRQFLAESGLPGMKVLQFAFDPDSNSDHLPHSFPQNCVAYTGTHDNDTVQGWMRSTKLKQVQFAAQYLGLNRREGFHWGFIRGLYGSVADIAIVPMQDFLGLDSTARMNVPAVPEGNWLWRVNSHRLDERLATKIRTLAHLYRRTPAKPKFRL